MTDEYKPHSGTLAVWGGEIEKNFWERATQVLVVHSIAYGYHDLDEWLSVALAEQPGHIYGRNTNPTVAVFEEKVRLLEAAEAATSFASGMAAISNTLFTLLKPGDRIVSVKDTYGGTNKIFTEFLPRLNIEVALCETTDHDAIALNMLWLGVWKGGELAYFYPEDAKLAGFTRLKVTPTTAAPTLSADDPRGQ